MQQILLQLCNNYRVNSLKGGQSMYCRFDPKSISLSEKREKKDSRNIKQV